MCVWGRLLGKLVWSVFNSWPSWRSVIELAFVKLQTEHYKLIESVQLKSRVSEMIPTLTTICQGKIMDLLEQSEFHGRLVNDLCRYVPDYLLEPIFRVLLEKGVVTDTALLAYLDPSRLSLKINQARSIRNSTFRQIGMNCPNLVRSIFNYVDSAMFRVPLQRPLCLSSVGDVGLVKLLAGGKHCGACNPPGMPRAGRYPLGQMPPHNG